MELNLNINIYISIKIFSITMTRDSEGILRVCDEGLCTNYDPDKKGSTGVRAHNIKGLLVYVCFNFKGDFEHKNENYCSGKYCSNRQLKEDLQIKDDQDIGDNPCVIKAYD